MITLQRIGRILFVTACCMNAVAWAAPHPECGERVSLGRLIANPDRYHGKAMWVVAHVTIDFENMTVCPSGKDTRIKNCLWLDIVDGPYKTEQEYARYEIRLQKWKQFDRQTVAIHATFDKGEKGHFGMWPGGLGNITEVSGRREGWSFVRNAGMPYNCMDEE